MISADAGDPNMTRHSRRRLLLATLAAAGTGAIALWRHWPEQGVVNPCRAALPAALANHEIVAAAWDGIDPANVWDCHAHLVGTGDSGSGIELNPRMSNPRHVVPYAQRLFYLNAGCVHGAPGQVDASYVERMHNLLDGMKPGCKLLLLAFDRTHDARGNPLPDETPFFVPNDYTRDTARRHPRYFEWAASVHPYRADGVAALEAARRDGARAVKWLPAAMNIDPAAARCDAFYAAMARMGMPLITHAGKERAVEVGDRQGLGNPLRLRRALEHGVRVIVAHCATMGMDHDLDRGENGSPVESFALFARLMDDPRYGRSLYGDLSAVTQTNRAGPALATIIERTDWHPRLVNGTDYPLPGIMPLYSVDYLVDLGLLQARAAPVLTAIRQHNPLLFDFVLKRELASGGRRLAPAVFETRRIFDR